MLERSKAIHAVRFYEDAEGLASVVTDFLVTGLQQGHPAVVIATPAHQTAIEQRLAEFDLDIEELHDTGALTMLDALDTLNSFLAGGLPDPERFRRTLVPLIDRIACRFPDKSILAYGEMVDLLWSAGQTLATTRLEILWSALQIHYDFSLLCGYALARVDDAAALHRICSLHSHVMSRDGQAAVIA